MSKTEKIMNSKELVHQYVVLGKSENKISKETGVSLVEIKSMVKELDLKERRTKHIKDGIKKIQNRQLKQAEKIVNLELEFKKLRIVQLEDRLKEYYAYYATHGDFFKRHPVSNAIIKDTNGMGVQLDVPNIGAEIRQLKEAVTFSQGMKEFLAKLESMIDNQDEDINKQEHRTPLTEAEINELDMDKILSS